MNKRILIWMALFTIPYILSFSVEESIRYDAVEDLIELMRNAQALLIPICTFGGGILTILVGLKADCKNPMESTLRVCSVYGLIISIVFLFVAIYTGSLVIQWVLTTSSCIIFITGWVTEKKWLEEENDQNQP